MPPKMKKKIKNAKYPLALHSAHFVHSSSSFVYLEFLIMFNSVDKNCLYRGRLGGSQLVKLLLSIQFMIPESQD